MAYRLLTIHQISLMEFDMLPDRKVIKANGQDVSYITINLIDKKPAIKDKKLKATFYLSGDAKIVGFENDSQPYLENLEH